MEELYALTNGFAAAAETYVDKNDLSRTNLNQFETWLCERHRLANPCRSDRVILLGKGFDEKRALEWFFEVLDEFLQERGLRT